MMAGAAGDEKPCVVCGRRITWRRKWARDWEQVKYCSAACRKRGHRPIDQALENAIMTLLIVITMTLSDVMNNTATAVIAAPIAVETAARLGANADAFLMGVAVAASCAFLTPIGHKNNTLIMGPGGYRFGDYWRMGLPLEILVVAVSVPTIAWVWPL